VTAARVEFVIDELVLHGFAPADRYAIAQALSAELQQLAASGGAAALARIGTLPSLSTAAVNLKPGARPAAVGAQVARAVHAGMVSGRKGGAR
jgi:hypothetical protein